MNNIVLRFYAQCLYKDIGNLRKDTEQKIEFLEYKIQFLENYIKNYCNNDNNNNNNNDDNDIYNFNNDPFIQNIINYLE